jgi:hypothetical protein
MNERWLPIAGYEGLYEISDHGRIRSLDRVMRDGRRHKGKLLKTTMAGDRLNVSLSRDGVKRTLHVHRGVLDTFVGPCPDGMECCHNDGDPGNCAVSNLRWDTHSANIFDQVKHGTHRNARKTHCKRRHEFTPGNTMRGTTGRACRKCHYAQKRASRAA